MYADAEAVAATFRAIGTELAEPSSIAFDYATRELVAGDGPLAVRIEALALEATVEEVTFGVPSADEGAADFLDGYGLAATRYEPLGDDAAPFGGLVVATNDATGSEAE
jgi:O-methyltransferase involved in polyketide biosynthesis